MCTDVEEKTIDRANLSRSKSCLIKTQDSGRDKNQLALGIFLVPSYDFFLKLLLTLVREQQFFWGRNTKAEY